MSLPNGINLIGISGNAGTGKTTLATYLHTFYQNVWIESFADPLKDAASMAFGIPRQFFDMPELKEETHHYWDVTPRKIAQFIGTEMFRDTITELLPTLNSGFWIKRLEGKLLGELVLDNDGVYTEEDTLIIPDVRFQDEYEWIVENGGIVFHLYRPGYSGDVGITNHPSETGYQITHPEVTHEIVNDKSLEELFLQVKQHLPAHLITA